MSVSVALVDLLLVKSTHTKKLDVVGQLGATLVDVKRPWLATGPTVKQLAGYVRVVLQ